MYVCWSLKGGVGTSVMAAALALRLGTDQSSVLVDLAGEQPSVLGLADADRPGVGEWLAAEADVGGEALRRVEVEVTSRCVLLPRGQGSLVGSSRLELLADVLASRSRQVVIDAGVVVGDEPWFTVLAERAQHRWLVTRACYLALRRVRSCPVDPTGVVLVNEPGRALGRVDVEAVTEAPVVVDTTWDPAVARAVDAGLLSSRLPRSLSRSLRTVPS
ncbi:MAG: hypothetical protein ACR2QE_21420 [Acidimicrobiales bacterium]